MCVSCTPVRACCAAVTPYDIFRSVTCCLLRMKSSPHMTCCDSICTRTPPRAPSCTPTSLRWPRDSTCDYDVLWVSSYCARLVVSASLQSKKIWCGRCTIVACLLVGQTMRNYLHPGLWCFCSWILINRNVELRSSSMILRIWTVVSYAPHVSMRYIIRVEYYLSEILTCWHNTHPC